MKGRAFATMGERGSVAVELALMTPAVLLLIWLFAGLAHTWRLESAVHRATAALADVLANQSATSADFTDVIKENEASLGPMFLDMVSGESEPTGAMRAQLSYGMTLDYYDTANDTGWSAAYGGLACGNAGGERLKTMAKTLVTSENRGGLKLLRVAACITYPAISMFSLITPERYTSSFIGVRREE